jgi:hypothetical protein
MVDCTWETDFSRKNSSNLGCNGGDSWLGYYLLSKRNITLASEETYPYLGSSGYCPDKLVSDLGVRIRNEAEPCWQFKPIAGDKTHKLIKQALYIYGPLVVYIRAGVGAFVRLGKDGLYSNPEHCDTTKWSESLIDHGVLLTGWKSDPTTGKNYMEIMNSWSTLWGAEGFGYIDEEYDCGLDYMVLLPLLD